MMRIPGIDVLGSTQASEGLPLMERVGAVRSYAESQIKALTDGVSSAMASESAAKDRRRQLLAQVSEGLGQPLPRS